RTRCSRRHRQSEAEVTHAVRAIPLPHPNGSEGSAVSTSTSKTMHAPSYLKPDLPAGLKRVRMPVVDATARTLDGYGLLVDDPERGTIEIVRWPAQGWRIVDSDSGNEGGTTEGVFISEWK